MRGQRRLGRPADRFHARGQPHPQRTEIDLVADMQAVQLLQRHGGGGGGGGGKKWRAAVPSRSGS
jgi:hypothetical protein